MKKLSKRHRNTKPKGSTARRKARQFRAFLYVTKVGPAVTKEAVRKAFQQMWPQLTLTAKQHAVTTYGGPL